MRRQRLAVLGVWVGAFGFSLTCWGLLLRLIGVV